MKTEQLKNILLTEIESVSNKFKEFSVEPNKHFTRKRKLPFEKIIKTVIGMESKSRVCENFSVNRIFRSSMIKYKIIGGLILWQEKRNRYTKYK